MLGSRFPFPSAVALLGSLWPSLSSADVPSSSCPTGVTAGSCYAGDYSNDTIVEISEPDTGATGASFDVYSSADLSNDASGPAKPIELDTEGGWGDDDSGAAGPAGSITLVNDGALSWSATGAVNEVLLVYALSRGGDGREPSKHGDGGVGGNGNSVQITNNGGFTATGAFDAGVQGIWGRSQGGDGGAANDSAINHHGGNGGDGGTASVTNTAGIMLGTRDQPLTGSARAHGITLHSTGGDGGANGYSNGSGDHRGNGGAGAAVTVHNTGEVLVSWSADADGSSDDLKGIAASSGGGDGANSAHNYESGGDGGGAGDVTITSSADVSVLAGAGGGVSGAGVYANSTGGGGGTGEKQKSDSNDGIGGSGGNAGTTQVTLSGAGQVTTSGDAVIGVQALARGGPGGSGGSGYSDSNSSGGPGGSGGSITISLQDTALVTTSGSDAYGILGQGIGGYGGDGGTDGGLIGQPGGAGPGGDGGDVTITTAGGTSVSTQGELSYSIAAQSIGGGGGTGSDFVGVLGGSGGDGGRGGDAGTATVQSAGEVATSGDHAYGLLAQAIAGGGGAGGIADGGIYALGGDGGAGGTGGPASVTTAGSVGTTGYGAHGILAQSIGGGGGAAGMASGTISIGGDGAQSYTSNAGGVTVTQSGQVSTGGDAAMGILAQSIGGGGGSGAGSAGIVTVGGSGSAGGNGGAVDLYLAAGSVTTQGEMAHGVAAQSVGGGGGNGGNVLDLSLITGSVGVGGSAQGGGAGGAVTLCRTARCAGSADGSVSVATAGDGAVALLAQSIGGGGGSGGNASGADGVSIASLQVGGIAGGGGGAAPVSVNLNGLSAATQGDDAAAVLAQSIGGGGGNGGNATDLSAVNLLPLQIGGSGASGGDSDAVAVSLSGSGITTGGSHAPGIVAQSIAGGGGSGGAASGYDASVGAAVVMSVGGSGSSGGRTQNSSLSLSSSTIVTGSPGGGGATDAHGVVMQVIAGGGGRGGTSVADALTLALPTGEGESVGLSASASVGGTGGTGNDAATASVTLSGSSSITTYADGSLGVLAQSIGGGGGAGGSADAFAGVVGLGNTAAGTVSAALGGSGGTGGDGGQVDLTLSDHASISTSGDHANAIVAQSIGGGGGNAAVGSASSKAVLSDFSLSANMGIGGTGGAGGQGRIVNVTLGADTAVATAGSGARGLLAQSISGGGGASQGGTIGLSAGSNEDEESVSGHVTLQIGRDGGSSVTPEDMTLLTYGTITTAGGDADAILAQSIGGSGGLGGSAGADGGTGGSGFGGDDESTSYTFDVAVGGAGGDAGDGGNIDLTLGSRMSTSGDWADGVVAQSIGGGGGAGGSSTAQGSKGTANLTLSVGGSGGGGGNGGDITLTSDDNAPGNNVDTSGYGAHAVLLQSIGGGGGQGADGSASASGSITVGATAGGSGGSSGHGGTVATADTAGWLNASTGGDDAHGLIAQSIGAGGGVGGAGSSTASDDDDSHSIALTVGAQASNGGDGGGVTLSFGADLHTAGQRAFGVVAQSIGGGGGIGGAGSAESITSLTLGGDGGGGGAGGPVSLTITEASTLTTTGTGSHAIVAQSIGGGGGIGGDASGGALSLGNATAAGAAGSGAQVSVAVDAGISTSGARAFGILAQSIGGGGGFGGMSGQSFAGGGAAGAGNSGTGGGVTVSQQGSISATGAGSVGIFAQSEGPEGNGTVAVTVNGAVTGGAGAGDDEGAGVFVAGGDASNTLTIAADASVSGGTDGQGVAIRHSGATLNTVNDGTINGQTAQASSIVLLNRPGGVINAGQRLELERLTNQGTLAVAGSGRMGATEVTGDLVQQGSGVLAIDLNPRRTGRSDQADRLHVGGDLTLGGQVRIVLADPWQPAPGPQSVRVISADGGVALADPQVTRSAVAGYNLVPDGEGLRLHYDIDFANADILAATNDNQDAISRHIQQTYRAEALDPALASDLIAVEDTAAYAGIVNGFSAEVAVDNQITSLYSALRFSDALLDCAGRSGDTPEAGAERCGWVHVQPRELTRDTTADNLGFGADTTELAGGGRVTVAPGWLLGGALAYERRNLDVDDSAANSDGDQFQGGLSLTRRWGDTELGGALSLAYGSFDIERAPWPGTRTDGTQRLWLVSGRLRAARLFSRGDWFIRPRMDLGLSHVSMDRLNESGDNRFRLRIDDASDGYFFAQPAVELGGRWVGADGVQVRPYLSLGVTQFIGNATPTVDARFATGSGEVPAFRTATSLDRTHADVSARLDVLTRGSLALRAEAFGSFSSNTTTYGGGVSLAMGF